MAVSRILLSAIVLSLLLPLSTAQCLAGLTNLLVGLLGKTLIGQIDGILSSLSFVNRYSSPVDSICITQSVVTTALSSAICGQPPSTSSLFPSATLANSELMMVGSAAQYPGATCAPISKVVQYNQGVFTPITLLPDVTATTAWQVSVWRASSSPLLRLAVINGLNRNLQLLGLPLDTIISGTSLLSSLQAFLFPATPRSSCNLTTSMGPIVDAYMASVASAPGAGLRSAVLLLNTIDPTTGQAYTSVAYVIYQAVGGGVKPTSLQYFEASFYEDPVQASKKSRARRELLHVGRHLLTATTDRSSSGACASMACRACSPTPPGCNRASASYPSCTSCCTCT